MTIVGSVSLDGIPSVLGQYDPSVRWNGWLCPSLDAHSVVVVLDAINAEPLDGLERVYDYDWSDDGALLLTDCQEPGEPVEVVGPDADGLYALGSHGWVWSAAD